MSQESAVNNVLPVEQVKVKKPRVPSLPAKDAKIIQAIYWYLKNQKSEPDSLSDEELQSIPLFASVEQQKEFTASFFEESKDIAKEIRKLQNDKKKTEAKAAKLALKEAAAALAKANGEEVPKQKRTRKPKATDATNATDSATSEPPADSKKKKNLKKVQNTQDTLINELVSLARGSSGEVASTSATAPAPAPAPVITTSDSEPAVSIALPVATTPEKPVKEKKDKPVKESKEKKDKPVKESKESKESKEKKDKPVKESKESKESKEKKDKPVKESKESKEKKDKPVKESKESKEKKEKKDKVTKATNLAIPEPILLDDHQLVTAVIAAENILRQEQELAAAAIVKQDDNDNDNDNDNNDDDDDDDDDDELEVRPFTLNGQEYLIADDSSLYHPSSQALIGHFDSTNNSIRFI
jgi:hypothetical protein